MIAFQFYVLLLQSMAQANRDSDFKPFIGEIKRGQVFQKSLARQITFELKLFDGKLDGRVGAYISILNHRNPNGFKFVLLPEVNSGGDANWVGVSVTDGNDRPTVDSLRSILDHYSGVSLCVNYFTDNLSASELDEVRGAWAMLHRHGRQEKEYERANDILGNLHRVSGIFLILDYRITENPLRIEYLRFSFDPCDPGTCE